MATPITQAQASTSQGSNDQTTGTAVATPPQPNQGKKGKAKDGNGAKSLAECTAIEQAKAIIEVLKLPFLMVYAALIANYNGSASQAATSGVLSAQHTPELAKVGRIAAILNSPAPAPLFVDKNNRGVRVGDLFATRLGLSKLFRSQQKENVKAAREHLMDDAR